MHMGEMTSFKASLHDSCTKQVAILSASSIPAQFAMCTMNVDGCFASQCMPPFNAPCVLGLPPSLRLRMTASVLRVILMHNAGSRVVRNAAACNHSESRALVTSLVVSGVLLQI